MATRETPATRVLPAAGQLDLRALGKRAALAPTQRAERVTGCVAGGISPLRRRAGGLGQLLPPGAAGNLLRSTGFFDGAAAGGHVAVLAAWAIAGLAHLFAAAARGPRPVRVSPAGAAG